MFILITACEEPVKFIEPQPQGKSNLSSFPKRLIGIYKSVNDDYTIEISDKLIIRKFKSNIYLSKTELDSSKNLQLKGNVLLDNDNNLSFKVTIQNDSITGFAIQTDSVFMITNDNVLRKFNGHYFLNTKLDNGYFVQMLTPEGSGKLTISSIKKEELDNLKTISAVEEPDDSLLENYQFTLTKKEFKNFVNEMHGFRSTEVFQKIKTN
jgi:rRNA-processing protein FCF1